MTAMPPNGPPLWGAGPPWSAAPRPGPGLRPRAILLGAVALAALAALVGSFYTVQPTEMAGVRRLGTVVTQQPVGPGLHTKVPLIDVVDTIQTSLTTFQLANLTVYTVDNQAVTVGVGLSYRVPEGAVLKLLYGVGRSGNVDIADNIRPILADRVLRIVSTESTVGISATRERIAGAIRREVAGALGTIFGLDITDLQLSSITYSSSFQASVEAAVQAKNDAIRAENTVARVRYEGEQQKVQAEAQAAVRVAQADGEARATVAQARSQREAAILRAEGEAQAATLVGEAQTRVLAAVAAAVAANPGVVAYETAHRWNGQMPSTVLGGAGQAPLALMNLPAPGR